MTRPLAKLVLPDGTTIRLRKVSVGPKHFYREPHPPYAGLWERIRHPFGRRSSIESHSPVLFLTEKSPATSAEQAAVLDSNQLHINRNRKAVSKVTVGRTEDYTIVCDFNYPRREKTMRLNLSIRGQWHEWELPNPLYGTSFPTWNAQPFPQTFKEGDVEFTATGWTKKEVGWVLAGAARYKGKAADHWIQVGEATDATGNAGSPTFMPPGEAAWKIRFSMRIGDQEPLSPDRLVDFGKAKVPADGEYSVLSVPPQLNEGQKTFAALVGKGTFAFRNGVYSASEAPTSRPKQRYPLLSHLVDKDGWLFRGEVHEPTFVIFELKDRASPKFLSDTLMLRCIANGSEQWLDESPSNREPKFQWRRTAIRRFPVGTEVNIRSVRAEVVKSRELLVPPPSPAERALADKDRQKQ